MIALFIVLLFSTMSIFGEAVEAVEAVADNELPAVLPVMRPADWQTIHARRLAEQNDVALWLTSLKKEAATKDVDSQTFDKAFAQFVPITAILRLQNRQLEFTFSLQQYLDLVVNEERMAQAIDLAQRHRSLLQSITHRYGVEGSIVVALWGLESQFGARQGNHNIIHALASLAYKGRRRAFFRKELLIALTIAQRQSLEPKNMMGSWAGAMGQVQFMPSSYQAYAQDFNQDGTKDIWRTIPDALASAANYLKGVGWQKGEGWGEEVVFPHNFDKSLAGLSKAKGRSMQHWHSLDVRRMNGTALPLASTKKAWLLFPDDDQKRAWLVLGNFKRILIWNRSDYFAIAVGTLADAIADG